MLMTRFELWRGWRKKDNKSPAGRPSYTTQRRDRGYLHQGRDYVMIKIGYSMVTGEGLEYNILSQDCEFQKKTEYYQEFDHKWVSPNKQNNHRKIH